MSEKFITSPLALAQRYAEELTMGGQLDDLDQITAEAELRLAELDNYAEATGVLGKSYFVSSANAVSIPVTFEAFDPPEIPRFDAAAFSGELVSHSFVRIGRKLGGQSMRAICLTFNNVMLLPLFDTLPDDELLHVPALAIRDMDRLSA